MVPENIHLSSRKKTTQKQFGKKVSSLLVSWFTSQYLISLPKHWHICTMISNFVDSFNQYFVKYYRKCSKETAELPDGCAQKEKWNGKKWFCANIEFEKKQRNRIDSIWNWTAIVCIIETFCVLWIMNLMNEKKIKFEILVVVVGVGKANGTIYSLFTMYGFVYTLTIPICFSSPNRRPTTNDTNTGRMKKRVKI